MKIFDLTLLKDGLDKKATMTRKFSRWIKMVIKEHNIDGQVFVTTNSKVASLILAEMLYSFGMCLFLREKFQTVCLKRKA
jgi:hypothetical protein